VEVGSEAGEEPPQAPARIADPGELQRSESSAVEEFRERLRVEPERVPGMDLGFAVLEDLEELRDAERIRRREDEGPRRGEGLSGALEEGARVLEVLEDLPRDDAVERAPERIARGVREADFEAEPPCDLHGASVPVEADDPGVELSQARVEGGGDPLGMALVDASHVEDAPARGESGDPLESVVEDRRSREFEGKGVRQGLR
jgi:hypothetical protein